MTIEEIRSHLDALGIASRLDNDRDLIINLRADGLFPYLIVVCVMAETDRRISFMASAPDYRAAGDLLALCNRHNASRYIPAAVVREGKLRFEYSYIVSGDVSPEFVRYDCILHTINCIRDSFANFESEQI